MALWRGAAWAQGLMAASGQAEMSGERMRCGRQGGESGCPHFGCPDRSDSATAGSASAMRDMKTGWASAGALP